MTFFVHKSHDLDELAFVEPAFLDENVLERGLDPHTLWLLFVAPNDAYGG